MRSFNIQFDSLSHISSFNIDFSFATTSKLEVNML